MMTMLIGGLVLFAAVHLFPAAMPQARKRMVEKLGFNAYRGLFSLVMVASLVVIVFGWKAASPTAIYTPPLQAGPITAGLVFLAFVLFAASQSRTNIRRYVRHPQMAATVLWSVAHLLANGDSRSVALFGGLGLWAVIEVLLCNRRDGAWEKPAPVARSLDVITVAIGAAGFALVWYFHPALFGVPTS
jgi:uncharacterized membrane protein